jgi:hypothetical protein
LEESGTTVVFLQSDIIVMR